MRHCRGWRPPSGGGKKKKDTERRKNDINPNPTEVHLDPPGWVSFQTLPWVTFQALPTP